jgi:hypothetical protein
VIVIILTDILHFFSFSGNNLVEPMTLLMLNYDITEVMQDTTHPVIF